MPLRCNRYGFEILDAGPIQEKRVTSAAGNIDRLATSWRTHDGLTVWSVYGATETYPAARERLREIRVRFGPISRANARAVEAALLVAYAELEASLPLEAPASARA
jgi:hypothetical protein